jgi:hypothetical protein
MYIISLRIRNARIPLCRRHRDVVVPTRTFPFPIPAADRVQVDERERECIHDKRDAADKRSGGGVSLSNPSVHLYGSTDLYMISRYVTWSIPLS